MSGVRRWAAALVAALATLSLTASVANAERPLRLGVFDGLYRSADASERRLWLDRTRAGGGELALTVVAWSSVAPADPAAGFDPRDPGDPGYSWDTIDEFVADASSRGLDPILTVTRAPTWAEGKKRPKKADPGTWKPNPGDLRDFAEAIATRYSGGFTPAGASAALPRVRNFQAWTEPNLPEHLTPQYRGKRAQSPGIYRKLLNGFHDGVKAVSKGNRVITAGTAPYGDDPGGKRVRPLRFWRDVLCAGAEKCKPKPRFDVLAHHPINTSGPPRQSAINRDDISTADLPALQRVLRRAPGGPRPLWVTEFWWSSKPPSKFGYSPATHAGYIAESLYLFWKAGAEVAINLKIRDGDSSSELPGTGLYYLNGKPKPAARAFSFPFVADGGKGRLRVWGKAPGAGRVAIESRGKGGWKRIGTARAGGNGIFSGSVKGAGSKLRASAGGERSLAWKVR